MSQKKQHTQSAGNHNDSNNSSSKMDTRNVKCSLKFWKYLVGVFFSLSPLNWSFIAFVNILCIYRTFYSNVNLVFLLLILMCDEVFLFVYALIAIIKGIEKCVFCMLTDIVWNYW